MHFIKQYHLVFLAIISILFIGYGYFIDYNSLSVPVSFDKLLPITLPLIANVFNMLYIFFMIKENIWSYFFGIFGVIATLIYLILWSPLIWDIMINIVYFFLNFYGIFYWLNPEKNQQRIGDIAQTRSLFPQETFIYTIISVIGILLLSFIGHKIGRYASIFQIVADASTTVLAILAQWLTTRKVLQSWVVWLLVNLISIPLYISINSYTFAMGFVIYALSSFCGYISWKYELAK